MRYITRLLLLVSLGATLASAQTLPHFNHIIIVIQENRTPDNLFGSAPGGQTGCGVEDPFEPGVDIENGGPVKGMPNTLCSIPLPMNIPGQDMPHSFLTGWKPQYDNGQMDGFCQIVSNGKCLQYSYVQGTDVQPYFAIAKNYGFANYFFQTNEGPSFPAHQFLFTGTSAPVAPPSLYFAAENGGDSYASGCPDNTNKAKWIDPAAMELLGSLECYPHDSLVTNANGDKGVTWRYYTPTQFAIWDAPRAIPEVCYGQNVIPPPPHPACGGTEWNHIVMPDAHHGAPILDDIANCSLQKISWVIPDKVWSDHPAQDNHNPPLGPSWVGDIVNAIGNSWTNSNHQCDYWGNNTNDTTAIFVVWDDWGGWFDHVLPPHVYRGTDFPVLTCPTNEQPNQWGCGYVYGFRVPFLVVSEYTKAGYVSGACTGNCPNKNFPYVHDFGSILAFTEYNFGMSPIDQSGGHGYADANALDGVNGNIPLSDFFSLSNQRNFTNIPTVYPPDFYKGYYLNNPTYSPTGPDGTDSD